MGGYKVSLHTLFIHVAHWPSSSTVAKDRAALDRGELSEARGTGRNLSASARPRQARGSNPGHISIGIARHRRAGRAAGEGRRRQLERRGATEYQREGGQVATISIAPSPILTPVRALSRLRPRAWPESSRTATDLLLSFTCTTSRTALSLCDFQISATGCERGVLAVPVQSGQGF
jgi:hypothetical protein